MSCRVCRHTHTTKNITSMAEVITHYFGVHHGFSTSSDNTYVMMTILTLKWTPSNTPGHHPIQSFKINRLNLKFFRLRKKLFNSRILFPVLQSTVNLPTPTYHISHVTWISYYAIFVTVCVICFQLHFSVSLTVNFLLTSSHRSPTPSPITCNNHIHFHILPSAVSQQWPWAAGCWLASVLMIWRSQTPALGINGLCFMTTGPSTHRCPHTQMPRLVIDGQWESQPLQT